MLCVRACMESACSPTVIQLNTRHELHRAAQLLCSSFQKEVTKRPIFLKRKLLKFSHFTFSHISRSLSASRPPSILLPRSYFYCSPFPFIDWTCLLLIHSFFVSNFFFLFSRFFFPSSWEGHGICRGLMQNPSTPCTQHLQNMTGTKVSNSATKSASSPIN